MLNEMRLNKKHEDLNNLCVQEAKLMCKYRRIMSLQSNSWKTLCLLYYGNSKENEVQDNESLGKKDYCDKVDQSKVCKYRLINFRKEWKRKLKGNFHLFI